MGVDSESSTTGMAGHQKIGLLSGIALFALIVLLPVPDGLSPEAWNLVAIVALMAVWWATEAIPIAATSLLPIVLIPALGISTLDKATAPYANSIVYLFLGGFVIALAVERWSLHRRIALWILSKVGDHPSAILLGFMGITALLSMWISNTSATLMMLPIAMSIAQVVTSSHGGARNFGTVLLLSLAYSASIGGVATLIGTPPNALMAGYMKQTYDVEIGFAQWMLYGVPVVLIMIPGAWFILARWVLPVDIAPNPAAAALIREEYRALGPMSAAEKRIAIVFALVATCWVFSPVLKDLIGPRMLSDTGIAILGALVLFLIPSGTRKGQFLMDWESASKLPWGVLILFGGGLSIAEQVRTTGLDQWLGAGLSNLSVLPLILLILAVTGLVLILTEFTSNTATGATMLPIIGALSAAFGIDPMILVGPAAAAATCSFMLPVGTPPNAIVFGTGQITVPQMIRAGFWINILTLIVLTGLGYVLMPIIFG